MVSLTLIAASLAAAAEAEVTDCEVAAKFAAAAAKGEGPHWQSPTPELVLAGRQPRPLTRTEYVRLRAGCKVNSLTRVGRRPEVLIDWRCGRFGEQRWNDSVTVESANVSHVLANTVLIQAHPPLAAASPVPLHSLRALFSDDDYPAEAIRMRQEGQTRVRLTVSPQGRVTMCAVVGDSGSAYLDSSTCRILRARARFRPARDAAGNALEGSIAYTHVWTLPGSANLSK